MASVTLHPDPQAFPIGTVVKVFALSAVPPPAGWEPSGAALTEPTVEAGEGGKQSVLTVTGLTVGKRYVGEATVSNVRRTLTFNGGDESSGGGGEGLSKAEVEGIAASAQAEAESKAATAAAAKDATLKSEAETKDATVKSSAESAAASKDTTAIATAEGGAKTAGDAAYRKQNVAIPLITRETFPIAGTVEAGTLPGAVEIAFASGQSQKLAKVGLLIREGTKVKLKLQKNGEDITGFTGLEATKTVSLTSPTAVALAAKDRITVVIESVEGSPKGLSVTLHIENSV